MALGTITNLGVGSQLGLQDILDNLREIDAIPVNRQKAEKETLEKKLTEFDSIHAKLIQMKSSALSLSLESNFLERQAKMSDEDIGSATVISGAKLSSYNINVTRLATKHSLQSAGSFEEEDSLMTPPPATGIDNPANPVITEDTPLTFTIGRGEDQKVVSLELEANATLSDIAKAINETTDNLDEDGNPYVKATVEPGLEGNYIRLAATDTNSLKNNQILSEDGWPSFITPDLVVSHQTGEQDPVYVTIPPGTSFKEVVSLINNDPNNSGVTAAFINDGSSEIPWHFTITADETGENNRVTLGGFPEGYMTETQGGEIGSLDALFSIDGFEYRRQSNDNLEGLIQGVTLDFDQVGETQLVISANTDPMKEKLVTLIETYNELVAEIDTKTTYSDDEEENGILSDVYSVKALGSELIALISKDIGTETSDDDITSLLDIGLELNRDGTFTIDQNKLSTAFSSSREEVTRLFIGDSENDLKGLGELLNDKLKDMTGSAGVINGEKSAAEENIDRLTKNIDETEERLEKKYEILALQFVRLDSFIGTMNAQSQYLNSIINSFNNAQQK